MLRTLILSHIPSSSVLEVEDDTIALNVDAMCALLPAPPPLRVPWRTVAGACESVLGAVHAAVSAEVESVVRVFAELEISVSLDKEREEDVSLSDELLAVGAHAAAATLSPHSPRGESYFPAPGGSLPKIVVTPCGDDASRAHACWVPLQDASFGNRLVVPAQPVVNCAFPPLALPKCTVPLPARRWEYAGGHWRAVLPTVEEQAVRRGSYARPLALARRRRKVR